MSKLSAVADVLKARFNNLSVKETIELSEKILEAVAVEERANQPRSGAEMTLEERADSERHHE